ncbi:MAG: 23S rRNA (uracil(1939)-C(5))-methyltransferase RlmD, partial [Bacilli bacterium]|nr:23S rRNA (uracil(1939)-C(5))-methyltransferase RlmD [Bacilli bacterium]
MEKYKPFNAKCVDISFEGKGVTKNLYGVTFVDGLFIGEEASIQIEYKRAGSFFGKVTRLITKSPDRIQPRCGVCSACGGCQFQQLAYPAQLEYKTNKVKTSFKRYNLDVHVNKCIGMDNPYNYRNKIQVPVGRDPHGHIVTGFYRSGTHKIIPVDKCHIEDERASNIVNEFKKLLKDFRYEPYNEDNRSGIFRHILIRTSYHYDEIMVTLVTTLDEFKGKNNFVKEFIKRCPNIKTIVQNINPRDTNVILGEKERILYGSGTIKDSILGVNFIISSKSFFQVNPIQVEKLYQTALDYASLSGNEEVFDAYCGIGTISLIAAKQAKRVLGVEIVKDAIKDANKNKKINKIENVDFVCDDASNLIKDLYNDNKHFDVVFVDPPRKGLDEKFVSSLLKVKPTKIVYVSCDPETLARDIAILNKEYDIINVQPVDMFPMTYH